jgi:uncharacterized protein (TIGR03437 family)
VLAGTNNPPELYSASINSGAEGSGESKNFRVGEVLPTTDRTMKFRVSVRDNRKTDGATGGSIGFADVNVRSVAVAGPFQVKTPNGGESYTAGSTQTITWNVAGTSAAPIDTATVRISVSIDSGKTYTEVLADKAPNTGSASVTMPGSATKTARVRIEATNNIYYDVSDADFSITAGDAGALLISSVVNAASFQPTLAPNTAFTVFGSNLGTKETASSTTLGGAGVTVCGTAATLSANTGTTINGVIPASVSADTTCPVVVTVGGKSSPAFNVAIGQQALGIFQFASGGATLPVATHPDFGPIGPAAGGLRPAQQGETIVLFCTGFNPGASIPGITVGGVDASVAYFGPSSSTPGLCQINFVVPNGLRSGANNLLVGDLGPFALWVN